MAYSDINGARLFYTDEGVGTQTILLVHGWACDSHDWSWQIGPLLRAGYRVIAVDLRGHGLSSYPGVALNPRTFAKDLSMLLNEIEAGPAIVMGHSLGAIVASVLAVDHAQQVKAVIAVDPAYGFDGAMKAHIETSYAALDGPLGMERAVEMMSGVEGPATPEYLRTWHRRKVLATPLKVIADTFSGIYKQEDQIGIRPASDNYLSQRACPVFAIYVLPERAAWESSTFKHPYSRAVSWEGSGHWFHQERPAEFNELILAWIQGLED